MTSVDFEVRIENIYDDDLDEFDDHADEPSSVTVTLEMSIDGDNLPTLLADEDEWAEWGEDNIFPLTGTGRPQGDAAYFAEISAVTSLHADGEFDYIVGKRWEWGL